VRTSGKFFVGTSNLTLPGPKATFPQMYQDKSRLHYYSTLFNSLEVNSSFYKLPLGRTLEKWTNEVAPNFRFTIKVWKEITHVKESEFEENKIDKFMDVINTITKNTGCLLIQFPPSVTSAHIGHVARIIQSVERCNKNKWPLCIEFRQANWYDDNLYELLDAHNVSLVVHDMPKSRTPHIAMNSEVLFYRFHGPAGDYRGSYTNEFLSDFSEVVCEKLKQGLDVYAYFNNTMGEAFNNARFLRSKVLSLV